MNLSNFPTLSGVLLTASLAVFNPASAQGLTNDVSLFSPSASDGNALMVEDATVESRSIVSLNSTATDLLTNTSPTALSQLESITVELAGSPYKLSIDARQVVSKTSVAVTGSLAEQKNSSFALVIHETGIVSGTFTLNGELFRIVNVADDIHAILDMNENAYPQGAEALDPPATDGANSENSAFDGSANDVGDVLDVLVVYTPAAVTSVGGQAAMDALIDLAIVESNVGLSNSDVQLQYNLVHKEAITYTESTFGTDLSRLRSETDGYMDGVHGLRDAYGADVVALIRGTGSYCGIAYRMTALSASFESNAFSVTAQNCATGYYSFAHEIGHNMGAHHDRAVTGTDSAVFNYSFGHIPASQDWRTIMSYANNCGSCTRVNRWSNAEQTYLGEAVGVVSTSSTAADNQLSLNNVKLTATNWRQSVTGSIPQLELPVSGSILSDTETFSWNANGAQVSDWQLFIGSSSGASDYYLGAITSATTATVSQLPQDGSVAYVRLNYRSTASSAWSTFETVYTTALVAPPFCATGTYNEFASEDWESNTLNGWAVTNSVGTNTWTVDTTNADEGTYHLHVDNPSSVSDSRLSYTLSSPTSGSSQYFMDIRHETNFEPSWDGGVIEYSTDSGATWVDLGSLITFGGYTTLLNSSSNPLGAVQAYSGASDGYLTIRADITSIVGGSSFDLRFRVGSDGSVSAPGWDIDAVRLYSCDTAVAPQIVSPVAGSTLPTPSDTFTWTGDTSGATAYWVYIGSTAGAANHGNSGLLGAGIREYTATSLPADGSDVFVKLFYYVNGLWESDTVQYVATSAGAAEIVSPVPGTVLSGATETFSWTAGGASDFWIYVGTSVGAANIGNSSKLTNVTDYTVAGLPTNGTDVYVRFFSFSAGAWSYEDYVYTAATENATPPAMTSPVDGSTLTGASQTFTWDGSSSGATYYWLYIGSTLGGSDIGNSSSIAPTVSSYTASNLPTDGSTVYVRLYAYMGGAWQSTDYSYVASGTVGTPELISPTAGSELGSPTQVFNWTANGSNPSYYWLYVGSTDGANNYGGSSSALSGAITQYTVSQLPADGSTVYVRLYSYLNGSWQYESYQFQAAGS